MLENILNEINKNLERVAKALESSADQVATTKIGIVGEVGNTVPEHVSQPLSQTTVEPMPQIPQPVQPQAPQVPGVPTTEPQGFTQEQLAVAMSNAVATGRSDIVMNILKAFNVQALTQINPLDYNKVATMLQEAGVKL